MLEICRIKSMSAPDKPFVEGSMPIFPKGFQVMAIIYTPWHVLRCLDATYLQYIVTSNNYCPIYKKIKWKTISGVEFQQAYQRPELKEAPNEKKLEPHED